MENPSSGVIITSCTLAVACYSTITLKIKKLESRVIRELCRNGESPIQQNT
jgi:hypothetical protein